MAERYRKKGNKYKKASAAIILNELEELCAGLSSGSENEKEFSQQLRALTYKLRSYYNNQGWL